jgi:glycosyltransferase involved in cell wall biosynthesis
MSSRRFRAQWGSFIDRCATQNVAIVLPDFNPAAGGCRVIAALANRFIQAGMKTTVYTINNTSPDDPDLHRLFEIKHISVLKSAGILIATRFDTVKATKRIPAIVKYYLVQQIETPMAKYCGGTEADVLWSYQQLEYEIITIGEHLAKQLSDMGRESTIHDVGLYVNAYPFVPHKRGGKFRVLMYGSPADYKGGEDAPLIAGALRIKFGDAIEINTFHKDLDKPAWADHHYKPQRAKEVAAVYSDHDVYVYASHSDGFAMTPVESMACGTPVVLTDFPGKDQYSRDADNCLIVPFRDPSAIAEAVGILMSDRETCEWLRVEGRKTAEHYDWSRVATQYVHHILGAPLKEV